MSALPYIKPSDARSWKHCHRRVWFDNFPPAETEKVEANPFDQLIIEMGIRHEHKVMQDLAKQFQLVKATSPEHTQALMKDAIQVIYQPQLLDNKNRIVGNPDFLILTESGEYQPADAKLSGKVVKDEIQIQLGVYRKLLNSTLPALVYHGNGTLGKIGDEANKLAEKFLHSMRTLLAQTQEPEVSYGETKCKVCPYIGLCKPQFEAKQELTLLYGVESRNAPQLEKHGIKTISDLANADPASIPDVPYLKGHKKKLRAVLQAQAYFSDKSHKIAEIKLPEGTWVHFDIETNPLTDSGKEHVYLWGLLEPPYDNSGFEYVWTDSEAQDRDGWLQFLEVIARLKEQYPDLILAHFSNYEVTKIKLYAKRYGMQTDPTVEWLLGENSPLFDIHKPVKASLVLPISSYGLKQICKHEGLVNFKWEDDESGSQWSVVQFVNFQLEQSKESREEMKKSILSYNYDDVMATRKLELWLRDL